MKISELNLAGTIAGTEVFPIVQGGETKKVSIADALAGAGGVPTLQQVTDVTDGNKTTNDIYNYYDIINNYSRLTNDFNGGGSQTPALEIQKINGNGVSRATLSVQNNNPSIDDYQDSFLYLNTNPVVGLSNQIELGSSISVGELTQQLSYFVNTIGTFALAWNYPSGVPRLIYNDINLGLTSAIEFSGSSIKTNFNNTILGLKLDYQNNAYFLGAIDAAGSTFVVDNYQGLAYMINGLGQQTGFLFDFTAQQFQYGDIANGSFLGFNNTGQGYVSIYSQEILQTYGGPTNEAKGLRFNYASDTYQFGCTDGAGTTGIAVFQNTRIVKIGDSLGAGNGNFIQVDDTQETIRLSTASGNYNIANIQTFTDNAAALAAGLSVGDLYRHDGALESADQLRIVH